MPEGVDVSHWQKNIDWDKARADGVAFAYVKATEGVGWVDPAVDRHLGGVRAAGLVPGLYHFARPDTNSASMDADHFVAALRERDAAGAGWLPPCLDLEERSPGSLSHIDLVPWVSEFLAQVRRATGRRQMMLYASTSMLRDKLRGLDWLDAECLVWVAHYGREPGKPGFKDSRTVMHQWTSTGRISGYSGNIDCNYCWVDLSHLIGGAPLPGGPPPGPPVSPPAAGVWYEVRAGDTLSGIASRLDYPGGWRALYEMNKGRVGENPNKIDVGLKLCVETYTVRQGDTLSGIAAALRVVGAWQVLWSANRDVIDDPDIILPGMKLRIPR